MAIDQLFIFQVAIRIKARAEGEGIEKDDLWKSENGNTIYTSVNSHTPYVFDYAFTFEFIQIKVHLIPLCKIIFFLPWKDII